MNPNDSSELNDFVQNHKPVSRSTSSRLNLNDPTELKIFEQVHKTGRFRSFAHSLYASFKSPDFRGIVGSCMSLVSLLNALVTSAPDLVETPKPPAAESTCPQLEKDVDTP